MTWYGVVQEMKNECAVCIHLRCYHTMIIIATLLFLTLHSCGSSVTYITSTIVKIVQYSSSQDIALSDYYVNYDYHDSQKINKYCLISNTHQISSTNIFCLENANFKKGCRCKGLRAKDLSIRRASNMQLKRHQMCDQNFIEQNLMTQLHQIIIKRTPVDT